MQEARNNDNIEKVTQTEVYSSVIWRTEVKYVNIQTGDEVSKRQIRLGNYTKIDKSTSYEKAGIEGICRIKWYVEPNRQTKLW